MQDTPNSKTLDYATEEVEMLRDLCESMALRSVEPRRKKSDVMFNLPQCSIFHFAGHGYTDDNDPSRSHLRLEDWETDPLTVSNFLEINIRQNSPYLAYLSACGTGQIRDESFSDESIHLIAACQLAGFRHVIGTLWEVDDRMCVDVARSTYQSIREGIKDGCLTDESVCRGLHFAIRKLRNFIRWGDENTDDVPTSRNASVRDQRDDRDGTISDEDDEILERWSNWVPYVHFGV
jgi:hypothetical protein